MKWVLRITGWLAIILAGAALLWKPVREKKLDREVRTLLLDVQEALQEYHVAEEQYPLQAMSGSELVSLLKEAGYLSGIGNPWGALPFEAEEGEDWLRYRSDQFGETYRLIALHPESEDVHFQLDIVENHSLEEG